MPTIQPQAQVAVLGMFRDGTAVVGSRPRDLGRDTVVSLLVAIREGSAAVFDSLLAIGKEMRISAANGEGSTVFRQPWQYEDLALSSRNGRSLVVLRQRPASSGDPVVRVEVQRFGSHLERVSSQTWSFKANRVDGVVIRKWLRPLLHDSVFRFLGSAQRTDSIFRRLLFQPSYMPAFRRAVAGSDDSVLLERVVDDSSHHWELRNFEGRMVGSFVLRPGVVLQDAADSTIWAIQRSAAGAESVLVMTLRPRG